MSNTGLWALRLLMVALAITPLRQLTGQPVLLRFRRMMGLYAFFYASHVLPTTEAYFASAIGGPDSIVSFDPALLYG